MTDTLTEIITSKLGRDSLYDSRISVEGMDRWLGGYEKSPLQVIAQIEASLSLQEIEVLEAREQEKRDKHRENLAFYNSVVKLKQLRLAKFDVEFVDSLCGFFQERSFYSEKQQNAINRLLYKYRKQLEVKAEWKLNVQDATKHMIQKDMV